VGERLSYPDERISEGKTSELRGLTFDPLSVMMACNLNPLPILCPRPRDEDFERLPSVPMTREEVRTIILDKLRLEGDSVVWDVGAGTGSVAIACSQLCPYGEVHALERSLEAIRALKANKEKFRAYNLFIHEGLAENSTGGLPRPTHVFIGGSGGALNQILEHIKELGAEGENIFVTISGVTLKTVATAYEILSGDGFKGLDVAQIAISRSKVLGDSLIMAAQNSVTLLSART
jgi:precorrin-6Y C5,15-methyltransferase (decarboxylating)